MAVLNVVRVKPAPVRSAGAMLRRLWLDESLYRDPAGRAWVVVEDQPRTPRAGANDKPVVVLGLSSRAEDLVDVGLAQEHQVPVVRRFTGGGTVAVDGDAVLVSIACNAGGNSALAPYPRDVMHWTDVAWLRPSLEPLLRSGTSFLWRVNTPTMAYLKHPAKAPEYRSGRQHHEFVRGLRDWFPAFDDEEESRVRQDFVDALIGGAARALRVDAVAEVIVDLNDDGNERAHAFPDAVRRTFSGLGIDVTQANRSSLLRI